MLDPHDFIEEMGAGFLPLAVWLAYFIWFVVVYTAWISEFWVVELDSVRLDSHGKEWINQFYQ